MSLCHDGDADDDDCQRYSDRFHPMMYPTCCGQWSVVAAVPVARPDARPGWLLGNGAAAVLTGCRAVDRRSAATFRQRRLAVFAVDLQISAASHVAQNAPCP